MKNTNCPNCDLQLTITNEVETSKRIKCPQCQKEFDNPYYESIDIIKSISYNNNKRLYHSLAIAIFIIGLVLSFNKDDSIYITQKGYWGAYSEETLDKFTEYSIHNDTEAINKLIFTGEIENILYGKEAFVVKSKFSKVKIRIKGQTKELWTVIEAIKKK